MQVPTPVYVEEVPTTRFLHPDTVALRKALAELSPGLIARYDFRDNAQASKFASKAKDARTEEVHLSVKQRGTSVFVERIAVD